MSGNSILTPVFVMWLLTFVVWVYLYARRIPFLRSLDIAPNDLTPEALARLSPPGVANPSDNFKNLFELPVLFYAVAMYLHFSAQVDQFYLTAAWLFTVFRILHSAIHSTVNIVLLRFSVYAVSALALWSMVLRIGISHLFN